MIMGKRIIKAGLLVASLILAAGCLPSLAQVVPYASDANTVLLDHFDGSTTASILGYSENGAACGALKPSATPVSAYVAGPPGLNQALMLSPPSGQPAGSTSYLQYPGGQLLSQANGTIEFWVYLSGYGQGLSLVDQGPNYLSCAGWTFGMSVTATGQLQAGAWAAFNMNSGAAIVPLQTWTQVAASWGSAGAKLYINGVQVGSDTNTGKPASGYGGSVMMRMGTHSGLSSMIDELRISNVQRTFTPEPGTGTHNAGGTYAWSSSTSTLNLNFTSTDFSCNGPTVGAQTQSNVSIAATTMIWPNSAMTWSRLSGTAGDIRGIWTAADPMTGSAYSATFNSDGTLSVTGMVVSCGGSNVTPSNNPSASSQHWTNGYFVQFQYNDSPKTATSVSVSGPGITGSASLTYDPTMGAWNSWAAPSTSVSLGTSNPAGLPYTYTFSITDAAGTRTANSTVSCFQQQFASGLAPSGSATGNPVFSWTGISDPSATYGIELHDSAGNLIWNNHGIPGTSITYNGPPLTQGMAYNYDVVVEISSTCSTGQSFALGSFTYGSSGTSAPSVPTGVNAVVAGPNQVNVTWNVSSGSVSYYQVYRNGAAAGTPSGAANNFWPDNSVVPGSTYSYTVAACDASNNCSAQSSPAAASIPGGTAVSSSGFAGTYGGADTGYWGAGVANGTIILRGFSNTTGPFNGTGSVTGNGFTMSATNGTSMTGTIDPSTGAVSGSWTNGSASGTLSGGPASIFAGTYAGSDSGNWAGDLGPNGLNIMGISSTTNTPFGGNGAVTNNSFTVLTNTGTTLTGTIDPTTGAVSGNWMSIMGSGTFTGSVVAWANGAPGSTGGTVTTNLFSGWNLIGNGMSNAITVATAFGDSTKVTTVWKWETKGTNTNIVYPNWAFYTPSLADGGAAYAASKGYDFLTTINSGEGFWVNAKASFTVPLSGSAVSTSTFADSATGGANGLPSGWSLIAVGDNPTPSAFNKNIGATPPATGTIPVNLITIWSWNATSANWYFYAPSLDAKGGTALSDYITSKSYLNYGTNTLTPTTGFWVNHP